MHALQDNKPEGQAGAAYALHELTRDGDAVLNEAISSTALIPLTRLLQACQPMPEQTDMQGAAMHWAVPAYPLVAMPAVQLHAIQYAPVCLAAHQHGSAQPCVRVHQAPSSKAIGLVCSFAGHTVPWSRLQCKLPPHKGWAREVGRPHMVAHTTT